jgi:hypothetical protein
VALADRGHSLSCEVTATNTEGHATRASDAVVVPEGAVGGAPPVNEEAPKALGEERAFGEEPIGAQLTCAPGKWGGNPTPTLTYQWVRHEGTHDTVIESATSSTYTLVEADQGNALSCRVTAINGEGVASKDSNQLKVRGRAPEDLEAPRVAGTPAVGQQLLCLHGAWKGQPPPSFTYQWLRDSAEIPSATASSYTVGEEDRGKSIACRVTASNSVGSVQATSRSVPIPGNQPLNQEPPEVSGTLAMGETLTCLPGTWSGQPAPTFTYQWLVEGLSIPGATASTYTVLAADRGLVLSCRVTATNRVGSSSATSQGRRVPGIKPENVEAPHVSGTSAVGQELKCQPGIWKGQPPPEFTYQWLRDGTGIAAATSATYTVELADEGHVLSCEVAATNSEGRAQASSSNGIAIPHPTVTGETRPDLTFAPVAATPTAGEILSALGAQLARAQHRGRISAILKRGLYAFSITLPAPGTLALRWYWLPEGAHRSTSTKPLVVALASVSFAGASTKTVKLRLTSVGRGLFEHASALMLTLKSVFVSPEGHALTWHKAVVLHR